MTNPSYTNHVAKIVKAAQVASLLALLSACNAQPLDPEKSSGAGATAPSLLCDTTTNCVNSLGRGEFAPLVYQGTPEQGIARLRRTLELFPEAQVVQSGPAWLTVIFTTTLGFRDEVVFVVTAPGEPIAYRSKSLVGLYDFGKNASRMREFAARFESLKD